MEINTVDLNGQIAFLFATEFCILVDFFNRKGFVIGTIKCFVLCVLGCERLL